MYTDDLAARTNGVLTAWPVQSTQAHAHVLLDVRPALEVPGVVRVLTAADVPGVNDAGVKHDEPLFPDRGDVPRPCARVGARRDRRGRTARGGRRARRVRDAPLDHHGRRGHRGGLVPGHLPHRATRRPGHGPRDRAARVRGRHRDRRPGALLPRDARVARARRLRGAGVRRVQHAASVGDAGDRGARARRAEPPGHRAGAAHGRRLRRQGDAAARLRGDRRARRHAHGPAGAACGSPARRTSR